jgi:hypothetical protein
MQRRIEIHCTGKGRGDHPQRLIGTLTDGRHDVGDKAAFLARSMVNLAHLDPQLTDDDREALTLAWLDAATRIGWLGRKTRLTNKQSYYKTESREFWVEETRRGRYFHFQCRSCGRRGDYMEATLTKFVDALHILRRDSADLSELSNII